jgi:hypothetical protein
MKCSLRLFKKNSFKVVRIFVRTSRRLMSDDITSIRAENLYVFQTINILRDQVISTSRVWLLSNYWLFYLFLLKFETNDFIMTFRLYITIILKTNWFNYIAITFLL